MSSALGAVVSVTLNCQDTPIRRRDHLCPTTESPATPLRKWCRLGVDADSPSSRGAVTVGMRDHVLLCCRLNQLLLLDTDAASELDVFEHLERYNDALKRIGESVRLRTPVRLLAAADVCAALKAMPDDLQLKILGFLADYDIVALLACRKTPCFSESTCDELLKKFPSTMRWDLYNHNDPSCWWRSRLAGAFDLPYQETCPFRELRRRSYQLGINFYYAVSTDHADPATLPRLTRWTSQDVPGDTIKVFEVTTRLEPPRFLQMSEREYLQEKFFRPMRCEAQQVWDNGKPRWFPPLVRVTEQGNPTNGRLGSHLGKWSPYSF